MSEHIAPGDFPAADAAAEAGSERRPGAFRALIAALIDALKTRLDLAVVETEIYLIYVARMLLWGFATLVCAVLALVFALTTAIVALWDTHRYAGLLGSLFVFVALAVICGALGARVFRGRPRLLSGTLSQLEHDQRRVSGRESGE